MKKYYQDKWEKTYKDEKPFTPVAKDVFEKIKNNGENVVCPCCKKEYNTLYRRSIYRAMGAALIALSRGVGRGAIHASSVGDFTKLLHWGLVEDDLNGYWVITNKGRSFISGDIEVSKYVYLRNNLPVGFSEEKIDFITVIGS